MRRIIFSIACSLFCPFLVCALANDSSKTNQSLWADSLFSSDTASLGTPSMGTTTKGSSESNLNTIQANDMVDADQRAVLAMSTSDYPVTPGDSYALTYITAQGSVHTILFVDLSYRIVVPNIGTIDARGKVFPEVKAIIERRVLDAYSLSSPFLGIQSCGVFPVYIRGEVRTTETVYLWGLSRLSDLWDRVTAYASNREISVRSVDGSESIFDLFISWRTGNLEQNPRLKPGDTVVFRKFSRSVTVKGEVRRPGIYQLLPEDGLTNLIEDYCDGLSPKADPQRLHLVRVVNSSSGIGEAMVVDYSNDREITLEDSDTIAVPPAQANLPVAFLEGAVGSREEDEPLDASRRIPYAFYPGETLSQAVQQLRAQFTGFSDLVNAYVLRNDEKKPVDISRLLYSRDTSGDFALEPNDVLVVPFRLLDVFVSGAVKLPGKYSYSPDKTWEYYVNMAGGFDSEQNASRKVNIYDTHGVLQNGKRFIQPEDSIVAANNDALYNLGRFATIASTVVSAMALVVTIINLQ